MILSIIIPIFKVEKYINKCLNSILPQIEREDIEVILINDGTPDNSAIFASQLITNYKNAAIYHQENQGLSCARNKGLSKAKGDYVWFIDSDDSIISDSIKNIIEDLKLFNPDLLQLNYQKTFEDKTQTIPIVAKYKGIFSGKTIINKGGLPSPAQFTIYKRFFLLKHKLYFMPGILHEDSEFKPRATYLADTILFHQPIVYNYLQRKSGSIMSSFSYRNVKDMITVINSLYDFSENCVPETSCKIGFRNFVGLNFNTILDGIKRMDYSTKKMSLELIRNNPNIAKEMIRSNRLKYKLEGLLFRLNTSIAYLIYSLLKR